MSQFRGPIIENAPLSAYTSYRIGGPAELLAIPRDARELQFLLASVKKCGAPFTLIGAGTNILAADAGVPGVICSIGGANKRIAPWRPDLEPGDATPGGLYGISVDGVSIRADAGALLDSVVRRAVAAGLCGLEKLSGIPGSVGGAVFMNAGAYNSETFDFIHSVTAVSFDGTTHRVFKKADLRPGYRHVEGLSGFIVTACEFRLEHADTAAVAASRAATLAARAEKQPLDLPSAGSVFKRPPNDFASRLIDEAGLKGLRVGGAEVSTKHAGFIVNLGGATAADVLELIHRVREAVQKKSGVRLELEQILLPPAAN